MRKKEPSRNSLLRCLSPSGFFPDSHGFLALPGYRDRVLYKGGALGPGILGQETFLGNLYEPGPGLDSGTM